MASIILPSSPTKGITKDVINTHEFKSMLDDYDAYVKTQNSKSATYQFWSSYLEMVENVLMLIRTSKEGNWKPLLAAIRAIMPWMFAYDQTNYSRYLPVYWLGTNQLQTIHPSVYDELMSGNFAVQRQNKHGFAQVTCDITIEQTANKDSKTRGEIKGYTVNKEASNRWLRLHHERAAIAMQCESMAGKGKRSTSHSDLTKNHIKKDSEDVRNITKYHQ